MPNLPTILIIEDDREIAGALSIALRNEYVIEVATNGKIALSKVMVQAYDIVLLDLNLPDIPGHVIFQQLRSRGCMAPVLVMSAEHQVLTKINMLDAGASDFLTKPFSLGELKARVRALCRSTYSSALAATELRAAGLEMNRQTFEVTRAGKTIALRRKEFALLEYLMQHAGSVVSREALIRAIWYDKEATWTNTVDVHIKYLRDKIDRPFKTSIIQTVHGRGYRLQNLTTE